MKINKERFDEWAQSIWGDREAYSPSRLAKVAGISKSSLFFQRSKDYVEANVVLSLSRGLQLDPLSELMKFSEFEFLAEVREPTEHELLSQVSPENLLEAILARLQHRDIDQIELGTMPEPYGLKRWLDTTNMYGKYEDLAKQLDLSNISVLSKKINDNRLDLGQLARLSLFGGLNGRFAMVVSGNLTWSEAGFSWNAREKVLRDAPGMVLVESLWAARKWLDKAVQVKELERGVFKNFG